MDTEKQSRLTFIFEEIGSAEFKIEMLHVTPGQLFAASAYLVWLAQQEASRISKIKDPSKAPAIALPFPR